MVEAQAVKYYTKDNYLCDKNCGLNNGGFKCNFHSLFSNSNGNLLTELHTHKKQCTGSKREHG